MQPFDDNSRLADFAEAAADWFWETDADHRLTFASDSCRDASGIGPEFMAGKKRVEVIVDVAEGSSIERHVKDLEEHRVFKDFRYCVADPCGQHHWISTSGKPIFDVEGLFLGFRGSARDITDDIVAAISHRETQDMLFAAFEKFTETFALWGPDDRLIIRNTKWAEINRNVANTIAPGTKFEDHIQAIVKAGLVPEAIGCEEEWQAQRLARHREPGEAFEMERQDGRWILVREERMPDGSTITLSIDITELKQREHQLLASEQRVNDYLDTSSDWYWEMDELCRFSFFSDQFEQVTGILPQTLLGKTRAEINITGVDPQVLQDHLDDLAAQRTFRDFRRLQMIADGRMITLSVNGKAIFAADGTFRGYRGTGRDISELVNAVQQADRAEKVLASAIENISDGFVLFDADLRIVQANSKFTEIADYPDHLGRPGTSIADGLRFDAERGVYGPGDAEKIVSEMLSRARIPGDLKFERTLNNGRRIEIHRHSMPDGGIVALHRDITEQVRESEAQYQALAEISPEGIMVHTQGIIQYTNNAMAELLGALSPASLVGRDVLDFVPEADQEAVMARRHGADNQDAVGYRETSYIKIDGSCVAVERAIKKIPWRGISSYLVVTRDITNRKLVEKTLVESEQRFRDYAEASADWFWEMDADLRFTYMSPNVERVVGVKPEWHYGKTREELLGGDYDPAIWAAHLETLKRHEPFRDFVYYRAGENIEPRWLSSSGVPIFDKDGEFLGYRGSGSDITEFKSTEEALRERESMLNAVVENVPMSLSLKDREGRFTLINPGFEHLHGVRSSEVLGQTFLDILPAEVAADAAREDLQVIESGEPMRTEYTWPIELREQHELIIKFPLRTQNQGPVTGVGVIALDVTEQKQASERLRQAQKMEAVGQLTGGVAHDFNNLLAVIMGNAELLDNKLEKENPALNAIFRASTRGAELTQRLLAYSRQQPLRPQAINLGSLVQDMSEMLTRTLGEPIEIAISVAPELWTATVDPGQVENALLNLALNARDAMPTGGKLSIGCVNARLDDAYVEINPETKAGDYVVLSVKDEGIGMTAGVQAQAFEPFFTTKDVGEGSGLGLSMIYGFAKQSRGHVAIDSIEGRGTTVKLYMPRAEVGASVNNSQRTGEIPHGHNETVLVIEDDVDVRSLVIKMLASLDYQVVEAADVATARSILLDSRQVDLILSDVVLPGGTSGPQFTDEVREHHPDTKIIFMSGYAPDVVERNKSLQSNTRLLTKPFERRHLAAALREVLDT